MATTVRASGIATAGSGTAISIARPTGTTTGDVVKVWISCNGSQTVTDNNGSTPFSQDYGANNGTGHFAVFTRRIQASDPATYNFTMTTTNRWTIVAVTFQSPHASVIDDVTFTGVDDVTGNPTVNAPSITTLTANAIDVAAMQCDGLVTITGTPAGYTVQQNGGDQALAVANKVITSPGATGLRAFTYAGGGNVFGSSVAIKDETAAGAFQAAWALNSNVVIQPGVAGA